jgi:hypothetical protein
MPPWFAEPGIGHFANDRTFLGSWGGFGTGPGQYNDAIGIAVDAQGLVHVLDDGRDVVETYDPDGKVLGSFSPHLAGPNTANSMALDPQGIVYISACFFQLSCYFLSLSFGNTFFNWLRCTVYQVFSFFQT